MTIVAITGAGPRTGTSWVMARLKDAGIRIAWAQEFEQVLPSEGSSDGNYYESDPLQLRRLARIRGTIAAKVWPVNLDQVDIDRIVVLRRKNREAQVASIALQIHREVKAGLLWNEAIDPELVLQFNEKALTDELERRRIPYVQFYTEDLDSSIGEIISYVRGVN